MKTPLLAALALLWSTVVNAQPSPWSPSPMCAVKPRNTEGLIAGARSALESAGVAHRITRTLDLSTSPANYHGADVTLDGKKFTAAVDISCRCLKDDQIQDLLGHLALAGFAAWYRKNGKDSWKGDDHIHAVWAAEPLKPQLRRQIASWLAGRTGLVGDAPYSFWQPTSAQRSAVQSAYEATR
jgi:hypothetical protein